MKYIPLLFFRIPLCKALGVKVTATVFTAAASQAVAKKAGFQELYKITYEELAEKGFKFPGVEKDTKYSKLMALEIIWIVCIFFNRFLCYIFFSGVMVVTDFFYLNCVIKKINKSYVAVSEYKTFQVLC